MALTDDDDATATLKACAVEIDRLRACLNDFLDDELTSPTVEGVVDANRPRGCKGPSSVRPPTSRAPGGAR